MSLRTKIDRLLFKVIKVPTCQQLETLCYDFLEENLEKKTVRAIERHLKICPNCLRFVESYRRMKQLKETFAPPALDPEFKNKMLEFFIANR